MERHFANAQKVAEYLAGQRRGASVNYAGLPASPWHERAKKYGGGKGYGSIIAFEIKGGREAGQRFVEALELHSHVANIGDVRSLVIHPASTTHSQLTRRGAGATGVTPGLVRLSVGLESIDDILADLDAGFRGHRRALTTIESRWSRQAVSQTVGVVASRRKARTAAEVVGGRDRRLGAAVVLGFEHRARTRELVVLGHGLVVQRAASARSALGEVDVRRGRRARGRGGASSAADGLRVLGVGRGSGARRRAARRPGCRRRSSSPCSTPIRPVMPWYGGAARPSRRARSASVVLPTTSGGRVCGHGVGRGADRDDHLARRAPRRRGRCTGDVRAPARGAARRRSARRGRGRHRCSGRRGTRSSASARRGSSPSSISTCGRSWVKS